MENRDRDQDQTERNGERSAASLWLTTQARRAQTRARTVWRGLMARPAYRWTTFGVIGIVAVLAIAGGLLLLRPSGESLDGFIQRWNEAVKQNDETLYETLLTKTLLEKNPTAYLRGLDLLRTLNREGKFLEPIEGEVDPNTIVVRTSAEIDEQSGVATLTVDQGGSPIEFKLERSGWARHWRIANFDGATPVVEESQPTQAVSGGAQITVKPTNAANVAPVAMEVPEDETPIDTELKLKQILEVWRTAWQESEIDAYMAWYADYAKIRRVTVVDGREIPEVLTKAQLRSRMERLAKKYSRIEVGISNVRVNGSYAEAELRFRQEYSAWKKKSDDAPIYHDIGIKTLKFVNDQGEWKIYEEDWHTYVNVPNYPLN